MDFYRNVDKVMGDVMGVSYNQITNVERASVITEPVTLSELKDYCRISDTAEDALLTALISASREMCETFTGVNFVQRQVTAWFNNYNGGTYLPYGPIGAITGIYDASGNEVGYESQGSDFKQILTPKTTLKAIYEGGYITCPEILKTAIKAQALFIYENRGDTPVMSPIAVLLLNPYKSMI